MKLSGMKVDLHVHSKSSTRPSQWILQKIDCPESFTPQRKLYEIAKSRGMDLVTITDHNNINGCLEIAHLPDTFISEEITAYFPENQCKAHVLAHDIIEKQHIEITHLRKNIYDLVAYLNQEKIFHVLAHPLFDLNHKLSLEYFEKMLLLFSNFELNGSRDAYQNQILESILKTFTKKDMELLADKHGIFPVNGAWKKNLTGGSDDHSSLNIARMYTRVPDADTREAFFDGISAGRARVEGKPATPKTMAHNLYGIAYQFYKSKFNLERYIHKNMLFRFVDCALTNNDDHRGILTRLQDYLIAKKSVLPVFNSKPEDLVTLIQQKANDAIVNNTNFQRILKDADRQAWEKEEDWFSFVNEVSEEVMKSFADTSLESLSKARIFNIFQTIGSAGSVYTLLLPYFMSFGLFTKDRAFAESCQKRFLDKSPSSSSEKKGNIAIFTDTLHETNGVALTLRMHIKIAGKTGKNLSVMTCSPNSEMEGSKNFSPIGTFEIPEYPEIKLHYPPVLKMLEYCYENNFTQILTSTPGPMGLAALAISRILDIPVYGTYHTAFPQYAAELTGDNSMEELGWKLMVWFYNQLDIVYVPSMATGAELAARGIRQSKIRLYPRGIDIQRFHPSSRNGFWSFKYQLSNKTIKLLYVGRISKEKNLDVLTRAFNKLNRLRPNFQLIIVGDGPYRREMEESLAPSDAFFTGYLEGDELVKAYASSDLFIFPSSTDTFGNVVLEAQASGIPVIVTDSGGPQENLINGETGLIVPAHNDQALVDAVLNICGVPERMAKMKKNARKYMENRSFEAAFNKSWELYQSEPSAEFIRKQKSAQAFRFAS